MKVINMRKPKKAGKIKAFFDVEHPPFILYGFKLMESESGYWVSFPTYPITSKDGKTRWESTLTLADMDDQKTKALLSAMAQDEYANLK